MAEITDPALLKVLKDLNSSLEKINKSFSEEGDDYPISKTDKALLYPGEIEKLKEAYDDIANSKREIAQITNEQLSQNDIELEKNQKILELQKSALIEKQKLRNERLKNNEVIDEAFNIEIGNLEDALAKAQTNVDIAERRVKQEKLIGDLVNDIAESIGVSTSHQETFLGKVVDTGIALSTNASAVANLKAGMAGMMAAFPASILDKVKESTMALLIVFDSAQATFNAATGAGGEFNKAIAEAGRTSLELGVGAGEAGAAMGILFNNMSSFTSLSKAEAATLVTTTAALENIGVASATTAQNLDKLIRFLGMSAEQAMIQQKELAEFASGIGVAPAQMAEDFANAGPLLVKYGQAGTGVFKDLAKTAKATGVEMNTLLDIAGQFDTFEGAADAAGKLNAILGGNLLNSVELMTAQEGERIDMVRQSIIESGRSFDQLSRFEKQAIQTAAGIKDLETAQKFFGDGSIEVTQKQKDFNEMVQKSQTVVQKMEKLVMSLAITMEPLVDVVSDAVSWITKLTSENRILIQVGFGVLAAFIAINKALSIHTALTTASTLRKIADTSATIANNTAKSASISIQKASNAAMAAGGTAAMAGAKGLLLFGIAAALVSSSVIGLSFAFQLFVDQLDKPGIQNLPMVAISMLGLAGAVGIFAASLNAMVLGLPGLLVMTTALGSLAASLALMKTDDLMALADIMKGMAGITVEKSISFKASMEGLEAVLDKVKDPEIQVAAEKTLVPLFEAFRGAGVAPSPAAAPAAPAGAGTKQQTAPTTVILKLNERELAKAVVDVFRKEMDLSFG